MNPPIKDLTDYLVLNSDSDFPFIMGSNLFAAKLPEKDGTIICLLDTGGMEAEPCDIHNPTIQLLARSYPGEYQEAYSVLGKVLDKLHSLANEIINGTNYIVVWKISDVISLGEDSKGRPILSCNLRVKRS